MPRNKIRIQTYLNGTVFSALEAYAQAQELPISKAVELLLEERFLPSPEQSQSIASIPPSFSLEALEQRIKELEKAVFNQDSQEELQENSSEDFLCNSPENSQEDLQENSSEDSLCNSPENSQEDLPQESPWDFPDGYWLIQDEINEDSLAYWNGKSFVLSSRFAKRYKSKTGAARAKTRLAKQHPNRNLVLNLISND